MFKVDNGGPFRSCKRRSDCDELGEEEGGDGSDGDCYRWDKDKNNEADYSLYHPGTRTAGTCFLASASPRRRWKAASTTLTVLPIWDAPTFSVESLTTSGDSSSQPISWQICWHCHTCRALKQFECQRPDHTFCQVQKWTFLFALDIPKKVWHLSVRTFCLAISAATTWVETFPTQPAQIQSGPWGLF